MILVAVVWQLDGVALGVITRPSSRLVLLSPACSLATTTAVVLGSLSLPIIISLCSFRADLMKKAACRY